MTDDCYDRVTCLAVRGVCDEGEAGGDSWDNFTDEYTVAVNDYILS